MGLRQVFQPRERSEIMALPYATADARAHDAPPSNSNPPLVYKVPESWKRAFCIGVMFTVYLSGLLIR